MIIVEKTVSVNSHSRYSIISEPLPVYYSLNVADLPEIHIPGRPVLSRKKFFPHLHRFAFGLLLGTLSHIMIDIVIWFSFVDIVWPLNLFPSLHVGRIDLWKDTSIPQVVMDLLTIGELWCVAVFFTCLRLVSRYRLQLLINMNENLETTKGNESDEINQSAETLNQKSKEGTLKSKIEDLITDKQRLLKILMFIEILHYLYGVVTGVLLEWVIDSDLAFQMVYDVLLSFSMPLFYFFSWRLKDMILW